MAEALIQNCPDVYGVIGASAGRLIKTLPSAIYWSALANWGFRQYPGTASQYHQALDYIYRQRKSNKSRRSRAFDEEDDVDGLWAHGWHTWHPGIPKAPDDFPKSANFDLSRQEALFIQERIRHLHPNALLADLAADPQVVDIDNPWTHPDISSFNASHRELLHHAHNFSVVAQGAAILYNQLLAKLRKDDLLWEEHRERGRQWVLRFQARLDDLYGWAQDLSPFWIAIEDEHHRIGPSARRFVEDWCDQLLLHRDNIFDISPAKVLVKHREMQKKGGNSRFTNKRVLDQWGGRAGVLPMTYRWNYVQSHIGDIAKALRE